MLLLRVLMTCQHRNTNYHIIKVIIKKLSLRHDQSIIKLLFTLILIVREAVNEMEFGKAPGLDAFPVECLKKGGMAVLEWLLQLLNLSFDMGVVPMDWRGACIVPLYKGKGDKCECSNCRGISLLSAVGNYLVEC